MREEARVIRLQETVGVFRPVADSFAHASGGLRPDHEIHPAAMLPGTAGSPVERRRLVEGLERIAGEPAGAPRVSRTSEGTETAPRRAARRPAAPSAVPG